MLRAWVESTINSSLDFNETPAVGLLVETLVCRSDFIMGRATANGGPLGLLDEAAVVGLTADILALRGFFTKGEVTKGDVRGNT